MSDSKLDDGYSGSWLWQLRLGKVRSIAFYKWYDTQYDSKGYMKLDIDTTSFMPIWHSITFMHLTEGSPSNCSNSCT